MFSFLRGHPKPAPPPWCSLDADGYAHLKAIVLTCVPGSTAEAVDRNAVIHRGVAIGLPQFAAAVAAEPRRTWRKRFEGFVQSVAPEVSTAEISGAALREGLRLRLIEPGTYDAEVAVTGPMIADDLQAAFTIALDDRAIFARAEDLAKLELEPQALVALALDNVFRRPPPKPMNARVGRGTLATFDGRDAATASRLLRLDRIMDVSPHGALAIVPSAHVICVANLHGLGAIDAFMQLPAIAERLYADSPNPGSRSLYWWRHSGIERIPFAHTEGGGGILPSQEFVDVLNTLA